MNKVIKKKWDKKKMLIILALLFLIFDKNVYGNSYIGGTSKDNDFNNEDYLSKEDYHSKDMEYDEIQKVIDELLSADSKFDFTSLVGELIRGGHGLSFSEILAELKNGVFIELTSNMNNLRTVIAIAIIAAIFTSVSYAFKSKEVADVGFYFTYLLLFTVLTTSFITTSNIAADTINSILEFMKVLIPTYVFALVFSTGSATSYVYYQLTLFLISLVDIILIKIVIPMINIQFIISITNNLSKRDLLSKMSDLLSDGVKWSLKTLLALVILLNTTSGLLSPVADNLKKKGVLKVAKVIPGIGDILGGVAETVVSASVLLKNAIGVAGLIVILLVCLVPLLKIGVATLIYKISSAVVQPISDERLINCISATAHATGLLFRTVLAGLVLFVITITIIAVTTT